MAPLAKGGELVSGSESRTVTLWCDVPGCDCKMVERNARGLGAYRRLLRSVGWRRRRMYPSGTMGDICPDHAKTEQDQ